MSPSQKRCANCVVVQKAPYGRLLYNVWRLGEVPKKDSGEAGNFFWDFAKPPDIGCNAEWPHNRERPLTTFQVFRTDNPTI